MPKACNVLYLVQVHMHLQPIAHLNNQKIVFVSLTTFANPETYRDA